MFDLAANLVFCIHIFFIMFVIFGGFLILKINDIKTENIKIDKKAQLKKMIKFEKERQLTRFSTLYYKRIYNNIEIDEY